MIYVKLLGFGLGLTIIISVFSALGVIFQVDDNGMIIFQIFAFLIAAVILTLYMKKKDPTLKQFGFEIKRVNKTFFIFIGLIVMIQPLVLGIDFSLSFSTLFLILFQMILVGYTEETLFRGVFLYHLQNKSPKSFLLFSSIVFGLLHVASGLNPSESFIFVILQIVNALLFGLVIAFLFYYTRTIYLVIAFHTLFNIFASIVRESSFEKSLLAVILLVVTYIIALIYFNYSSKRASKIVV
ncbi:CPBP family intramembrane glutamic endopeptidase [Sporosarcina sp. D27]|uniref:CPBP family intramembrane glutamic endopeptidase n=1 Tax=Sporosarcina sp. D27 TaxID=1382305 RepID=UPI0004723388|nr:CPBP family intramembrane glutamic endopeptidase [Sporosarcina sp. D27]